MLNLEKINLVLIDSRYTTSH